MRASRLIGPGVVGVFVLMALATYITWEVGDRNQVTGDEPHYLVVADSIGGHGSLEVSDAYRVEFETREFFPPGLAPAGTEPSEGPSHSVDGPRGLFSIHSLGLPTVLALPVLLGGTVLAKLVMIAIAAIGVWLVWLIGTQVQPPPPDRVRIGPPHPVGSSRIRRPGVGTAAAVIVTTCGMTLIVASNQVYPDVPAGVLALAVLVFLLGNEPARASEAGDGAVADPAARAGRAGALWCCVALAALPWMHLKALAPAAVLGAAVLFVEYRRGRSTRQLATLLIPPAASLGVLAIYNWWAFDRVFGPYGDGALEFGGMSLTVFLGLYVDQFQGMLVQNPALALGLVFLVPFVRRFPVSGSALVLAHLAFVVPNALHPNWYGGASFAGRFGVSGALVLAPVAVFGIGELLSRGRTAWALVVAMAVYQLVQFVRYAILGRDLYNSLWELPASYHSHVPVARGFLPMLYDSSWSLSHPPNIAGALVVLGLIGAGVCLEWRPRLTLGLVGASVVVVLAAGLVASEPRTELVIAGYRLPRINATAFDDIAVATGEPGVVTYGPYVSVGDGLHQFEVVFRAESIGPVVGGWELVVVGVDEPLASGQLVANGGTARAGVEFDVPDRFAGREIEMRTLATGSGPFAIVSIVIRNVPGDGADPDPMGADAAASAEVVR